MIQAGDTLSDAQVFEFVDEAREGCTLGPNALAVREQTASKRVVIFGLPGAFTPTCSAKHVPGYVEQCDAFRAAGIDENLVCVRQRRVQDGRLGTGISTTAGKVRMIADGSAAFTHALGNYAGSVRARHENPLALLKNEWVTRHADGSSRVELASDQKPHHAHGREVGVPASFSLRGLEKPVDSFQEAPLV